MDWLYCMNQTREAIQGIKCKAVRRHWKGETQQVYTQTSPWEFCSSAQQSVEWFGKKKNVSLWFTPKSPEGFETDTHDEAAGLWTADMWGFVLWLFRSAFISSAAWRSPFSTRLRHREWRLSHWHCFVLISSVWWQLAERRDTEAGRQHLDDAATSRGSTEHHSYTHTRTHAHSEKCAHTQTHVFTLPVQMCTVETPHTRLNNEGFLKNGANYL